MLPATPADAPALSALGRPGSPCQPLCSRLGAGLSKADSPDGTSPAPSLLPAMSLLSLGAREATVGQVWEEDCRAVFLEYAGSQLGGLSLLLTDSPWPKQKRVTRSF